MGMDTEARGAKVRLIGVREGGHPQGRTLGREHLLVKLRGKECEGPWGS